MPVGVGLAPRLIPMDRAPASCDLAALVVSIVSGGVEIEAWRRGEVVALREARLGVRVVTVKVQTDGHARWDAGRHATRAA